MAVQTAAEALSAYEAFRAEGRLIQNNWHTERDGRELACGLGVLGRDVSSPRDCPASVMPRWLAQMVPGFFDRQKPEDAFAWGERFYTELARLGGVVPFTVINDWHAECVCPLAIEVATKRGKPTAPHEKLQALHRRARGGDLASRGEWHEVLRDANAYADAYANANAYADADAYAYAYAYAYANANAYAYAYAYAYANADAYADAYAWKRLADGMVDALSRASAPAVSQAEAA